MLQGLPKDSESVFILYSDDALEWRKALSLFGPHSYLLRKLVIEVHLEDYSIEAPHLGILEGLPVVKNRCDKAVDAKL